MNILVYTNQVDSLEYLQRIVKLMKLDIKIDEVENEMSFFELYEKNIYDILFVEYSEDIWKNILNNIIHTNARQKIILISNTFACSLNNDCVACQKKYNVNILIKPILDIKTSELFMRKFICEEYETNELQFKLLQLNKQLNLDHGTISFDIKTLTYKFESLIGHRQILALSDLVSELNKKELKYEVLHNFDVKVFTQ